MTPSHVAVLHFHFFFFFHMHARTPHSCCHRLDRRLPQDYRSDRYPRHHLRIAIISQQLGLFHFPSSPSSPSSLPSSSPADDTYHPLLIRSSHFVSPTPIITRIGNVPNPFLFLLNPPSSRLPGLSVRENVTVADPEVNGSTNSSSVAVAILVPFFALIFAGLGFYLYKQRYVAKRKKEK